MTTRPIPIRRNPNEGYGQLSINSSFAELHPEATAGVWGLIGLTADVEATKGRGPSASAAVVAYSSADSTDAVYAESTKHTAVTAVGHTDNAAAIQATHTGATGG